FRRRIVEMKIALKAVCAGALIATTLATRSQGAIALRQSLAVPLKVLAQGEVLETKARKPAAPAGSAPHSLSTPTPGLEAPTPQAPPGAVGEFQPVLHAQSAKITTCMDTIIGESASVIDSAHTAISSWSTTSPDENGFVSIIGLNYENK